MELALVACFGVPCNVIIVWWPPKMVGNGAAGSIDASVAKLIMGFEADWKWTQLVGAICWSPYAIACYQICMKNLEAHLMNWECCESEMWGETERVLRKSLMWCRLSLVDMIVASSDSLLAESTRALFPPSPSLNAKRPSSSPCEIHISQPKTSLTQSSTSFNISSSSSSSSATLCHLESPSGPWWCAADTCLRVKLKVRISAIQQFMGALGWMSGLLSIPFVERTCITVYGSSSFIVVSSHTLHVAYIDFGLRHLSSNHSWSHTTTTLKCKHPSR